MKIVIAPDSYKGSLTAAQVSETIGKAMRDRFPDADIVLIPMADGGEGTVDALVAAAKGEFEPVRVTGPLGEPVLSRFGTIGGEASRTAVLEAANLFGLPMVPEGGRNPFNTTSRGLGDAIVRALDIGLRRFVIGLGGSSTNDGGIGMLSALGAVFTDADGRKLDGYGRDLTAVAHADFSGLDTRLRESRITVACDVTNPLLGPLGASAVFGPQKGATPEQVQLLDTGMAAYAELVEAGLGDRFRDTPGAGAAGGLGFALLALGGAITPGAQVVEEMTGLKEHIADSDWVFTGEGRSDGQTLMGKLPFHVAKLANDAGSRAVLISGSLGDGSERLNECFAGCFSTVAKPCSLQECMDNAEQLLYACASSVASFIYAAQRPRSGS